MNIGMVVVCYNGYGKFLPQLLSSIKEIDQLTIVAMGKDHGLGKIKNSNIERINVVYLKDIRSLGEARNVGVEATDTHWILYFSIDDILLPNAEKEMENQQDKDVIFLQFETREGSDVETYDIVLPNDENIRDWETRFITPGYVAFKKSVWEKNPYIDSEFPNLPFIFQAYRAGYQFTKTENVCAAYLKRNDSHSASLGDRRQEAIDLINSYIGE